MSRMLVNAKVALTAFLLIAGEAAGADTAALPVSTHTTDAAFNAEVIQASAAQLVLVSFTAEWCSPCQSYDTMIKEVARGYADKAKLVFLNIDDNPQTPTQYGVHALPTTLIFRMGSIVAAESGAVTKDALTNQIKVLIQNGASSTTK